MANFGTEMSLIENVLDRTRHLQLLPVSDWLAVRMLCVSAVMFVPWLSFYEWVKWVPSALRNGNRFIGKSRLLDLVVLFGEKYAYIPITMVFFGVGYVALMVTGWALIELASMIGIEFEKRGERYSLIGAAPFLGLAATGVIWLSFKDIVRFIRLRRISPNTREVIEDALGSFHFNYAQQKYLRWVEHQNIVPIGTWRAGLPRYGDESDILLAKFEEKWLGIRR